MTFVENIIYPIQKDDYEFLEGISDDQYFRARERLEHYFTEQIYRSIVRHLERCEAKRWHWDGWNYF